MSTDNNAQLCSLAGVEGRKDPESLNLDDALMYDTSALKNRQKGFEDREAKL